MICKVIETIEKHGLLTNIKSVAVGVSGGADSMCLLHILNLIKEKYGITLKAVHINHNIRGDEAKRDEDFVRNFCEKNSIEFNVFSVDVPALSKEYKLSEEEAGRKARYDCFSKINCDAVAVAHSLSDSVETIIFNLARGTGLRGLCGITAKREPNIIRPLIDCTRDEIEEYCHKNNIQYVTDSTNLSDNYKRNIIRHKIIPVLNELNSDYLTAISRSAHILEQEHRFVENCAQDVLKRAERNGYYDAEVLRNCDPALRKRCLHSLLKRFMNKDVEAKHIELCEICLMKSEGKLELAKDFYVLFSADKIYFETKEVPVESWLNIVVNNKAVTPFGTFKFEPCGYNDKDAFNAAKVTNPLLLSSRREGDKISIGKRGVTKTLKKLFNEMKVPLAERNKIAVLRDGENIIWVEGVGTDKKYLPDKNAEDVIRIIKEA